MNLESCDDCSRPYGDEFGFPDLMIPNDVWRQISPSGNDRGKLCPSCLCARLHQAGMTEVPGTFTSGPIQSVDQETMAPMLWNWKNET